MCSILLADTQEKLNIGNSPTLLLLLVYKNVKDLLQTRPTSRALNAHTPLHAQSNIRKEEVRTLIIMVVLQQSAQHSHCLRQQQVAIPRNVHTLKTVLLLIQQLRNTLIANVVCRLLVRNKIQAIVTSTPHKSIAAYNTTTKATRSNRAVRRTCNNIAHVNCRPVAGLDSLMHHLPNMSNIMVIIITIITTTIVMLWLMRISETQSHILAQERAQDH